MEISIFGWVDAVLHTVKGIDVGVKMIVDRRALEIEKLVRGTAVCSVQQAVTERREKPKWSGS